MLSNILKVYKIILKRDFTKENIEFIRKQDKNIMLLTFVMLMLANIMFTFFDINVFIDFVIFITPINIAIVFYFQYKYIKLFKEEKHVEPDELDKEFVMMRLIDSKLDQLHNLILEKELYNFYETILNFRYELITYRSLEDLYILNEKHEIFKYIRHY